MSDTTMAIPPAVLAAYAGTYYSQDAETTFEASVTNGARSTVPGLTEQELDAVGQFISRSSGGRQRASRSDRWRRTGLPGSGTVWFTRDASGRVAALHVGTGRAYDVVFERR